MDIWRSCGKSGAAIMRSKYIVGTDTSKHRHSKEWTGNAIYFACCVRATVSCSFCGLMYKINAEIKFPRKVRYLPEGEM